MGSKAPRVLIIGESSVLSYLTCVLTRSEWHVTVLSGSEKRKVNKNQTWLMLTESHSYRYSPHLMLTDPLELKTLSAANAKYNYHFDFVVFETKGQRVMEENAEMIKSVIHEKTLFMADSSDNLWLVSKIEGIFCNHVMLAMYSDLDCRMLGTNTNCFQIMEEEKDLFVGYNGSLMKRDTDMSLRMLGHEGMMLMIFKSAYEMFSNKGIVETIHIDKSNRFNRRIWMRLLTTMSFEALSIIFEESHIVTLAKEINVVPIMKGIFNELLHLGRSIKIDSLPKEYSTNAKKLLKDLIIEENMKSKTRKALTAKKCFLPKFIESNKMFYDFSQGYSLGVVSILFEILNLADENLVKVPFIESIYSFTDRLITIRDGIDFRGKVCPSRLFQAKNNKNSMLKLMSINGIPPEKNMMNFPPFNPLPLPKPPTHVFIEEPLVFMSGVYQTSNENPKGESDDDNVSIDSQLEGLMVGRENLTYGNDVFFDANTGNNGAQENFEFNNEPATTEASTINTNQNKSDSDSQSYVTPVQTSNAFPVHTATGQVPVGVPTFQPSQMTHLADAQGNVYMMQPNGNIVLLNPLQKSASPQYSRNATKKKQTFYHVPISIGKHTPSHKLRESHHSLLELVQFNGLMDQGTSSRYGNLDTSSTALNSANNSGRSSARSSLAPSRDSMRVDSPRTSIQKQEPPTSQPKADDEASEETNKSSMT